MSLPALKQEPEPLPQQALAPLRRSVSEQMRDRFESRKTWRRFVSLLYVAVMTGYLAWRYTIINPHSLALSWTYFVAEFIGFILGLTAIYNSWNYNHRTPTPACPGLSVDVMVPVYKEPLNIIRRTVMAAKAIEYPHNTFLLDDGKRDELKALAEELGVRYLRRPGNQYAKAGNLNDGLSHSKADFVMTLDADHIALPHALDVMLGFFDDEGVAMVQTPQDYYNVDAFQYMNSARSGALWHDQSAFYNISEPCADGANAASCVGTGVVYRRTALDKIGGIPVETLTEDIHTSLKLHKQGFRTVFLNEPVAYGVAASDLGEYYKTRHRWGHGNLQALKVEKILTCKGLTLRQRLHYLSLGLIYLEGWQQVLLFAIPVVALVFGLQPFTITIANVLTVLLFPIVSYLLLQETGCGFARYWANEMFAMARWPVYIASTGGLFGRKMSFLSSSKKIEGKVNWRLMAPQLTVMAASLFALLYAVFNLAQKGFQTGPLLQVLSAPINVATGAEPVTIDFNTVMDEGYTADLVAIAGAWAVYSMVKGALFIRKVLADARNTHDFFRFSVPVPAFMDDKKTALGCVTSISENWVRLTDYRAEAPYAAVATVEFTAILPSGPVPLKVSVANVSRQDGVTILEGELLWPSESRRDGLAASLYSVDWHREFLHRSAYFLLPSDFVRACFGRKLPVESHPTQPAAVLYNNGHYGIIFNKNRNPDEASFVTFQQLEENSEFKAAEMLSTSHSANSYRVLHAEPLHSLVGKGLDGALPFRYRIRTVA